MSTPDLLTIVSDYLSLEKSRLAYKGSCPFHNDQAASFMVSPGKNIYKCFGCGAEGDAADFKAAVKRLNLRPIAGRQ